MRERDSFSSFDQTATLLVGFISEVESSRVTSESGPKGLVVLDGGGGGEDNRSISSVEAAMGGVVEETDSPTNVIHCGLDSFRIKAESRGAASRTEGADTVVERTEKGEEVDGPVVGTTVATKRVAGFIKVGTVTSGVSEEKSKITGDVSLVGGGTGFHELDIVGTEETGENMAVRLRQSFETLSLVEVIAHIFSGALVTDGIGFGDDLDHAQVSTAVG